MRYLEPQMKHGTRSSRDNESLVSISFNAPPMPFKGKKEREKIVAINSVYLVLFFLITCHTVAAPIDMS
jgi:hypothetical protein